jgi:ABC-type lipoprotein export system ATPase subunit
MIISPESLSSGQRKCISLERAFLEAHPVILIDEPENALDLSMQKLLQAKILDLRQSGHIIVLFSHSDVFLSICDQVIQLSSLEHQTSTLPCST